MDETNVLIAGEGTIYTNDSAYGYKVELGTGDSADNWHQIPIEEYEAMMAVEDDNHEII